MASLVGLRSPKAVTTIHDLRFISRFSKALYWICFDLARCSSHNSRLAFWLTFPLPWLWQDAVLGKATNSRRCFSCWNTEVSPMVADLIGHQNLQNVWAVSFDISKVEKSLYKTLSPQLGLNWATSTVPLPMSAPNTGLYTAGTSPTAARWRISRDIRLTAGRRPQYKGRQNIATPRVQQISCVCPDHSQTEAHRVFQFSEGFKTAVGLDQQFLSRWTMSWERGAPDLSGALCNCCEGRGPITITVAYLEW